jgi:hypothetical protein
MHSQNDNDGSNASSKPLLHIVRISTKNPRFCRDRNYFDKQRRELRNVKIKSTSDDGKGTLYIYLASSNDAHSVVQNDNFFGDCLKVVLDINKKTANRDKNKKQTKEPTDALLTGFTIEEVSNSNSIKETLEKKGVINFEQLSSGNTVSKAIKIKFDCIESLADVLREDNGWIDIAHENEIKRVRIKPETPQVMQCKNCGYLDHWTSDCSTDPLCLTCGDLLKDHVVCTQAAACINCGGDHSATDKKECHTLKKKINDMTQKRINQIINGQPLNKPFDPSNSSTKSTTALFSKTSYSNRNYSNQADKEMDLDERHAFLDNKIENKTNEILNAMDAQKIANNEILNECKASNRANMELKTQVESLTNEVSSLLKNIKAVVREQVESVWKEKETDVDNKLATAKSEILALVAEKYQEKTINMNTDNYTQQSLPAGSTHYYNNAHLNQPLNQNFSNNVAQQQYPANNFTYN